MHLATEAQKTMLDIMNQGNSNIDSASSEILQEGKNIASTLAQVNQLLQNALNGINVDTSNPLEPFKFRKTTTQMSTYANPHMELVNTPIMNADGTQKRNEYGELLYDASFPKQHIVMPTDAIPTYSRDVRLPQRPPVLTRINDGAISADGQSMSVAASRITPINDGTVATTNPQDHAIFAKTGGPFDTLFNGIFAKINDISSVLPKSMPYEFPEQTIKELYKPLYNQQNNSNSVSNSPIKVEPITLNINLDGALGKSKDFLEEITNNPMLVRSLSQLISESINKNINGGKSTYTVGLSTARFKNIEF